MDTPIDILCIATISAAERSRIETLDPRFRVVEAGSWFDGEIRETWPPATSERFLAPDSKGRGTRAERDGLLAQAEIVLVPFPFPLDLRARGSRLKWVHQRPAGASNQKAGDLWGSDVTVTTSRGYAANLPMAEYVIAGFLYFARALHRATEDRIAQRFDKDAYRPVQLSGKTACIVGAGGIGQEVGRLAAALGMRVVGTRRSAGGDLPAGFDEIRGPDGLFDLLGAADFVAVCCQWTPQTEGLIGHEAFAAVKPGAVLVNVARGEIVDEAALIAALAADRLRGAALDVYVGEFAGPPDERLWSDPRVLITPHVSGGADVAVRSRYMDVFCRNLEAYRDGQPLENVIDWARGY
ncbi:MAG: phosphoglycerate dehydrogenase-like enzyme [Alphaproteobacteria bacterium]|jgi:phosphoglycerate dehydrogenase-like enzyme